MPKLVQVVKQKVAIQPVGPLAVAQTMKSTKEARLTQKAHQGAHKTGSETASVHLGTPLLWTGGGPLKQQMVLISPKTVDSMENQDDFFQIWPRHIGKVLVELEKKSQGTTSDSVQSSAWRQKSVAMKRLRLLSASWCDAFGE